MDPYAISALVTVFSSLFAFYLAYNVGMVRMKHKAAPYKHTENDEVWIVNRVHMNTIENMAVYLPLLWVATVFGSAETAGAVGAVWFVSRVWYAFGYLNDPKKRQTPFMLGLACIAVTAIIALYGIVV